MKRIVIGVTGASGTLYAKRLIEGLLTVADTEIYLIISNSAKKVAALEEVNLSGYPVHYEENTDLAAGIASGSFQYDAMVVVPCSMKSLAAISHGYATNLIARAADVCLKERRTLVLVPRETPYSRVHLTNMLAAHDAGAVILPASPPLYTHPATIEDLIDMVVARILDHCKLEHTIGTRWKQS